MKSRYASFGLMAVLVVLIGAALALGDKITLKNGTVIEGTAIKSGSTYWIKGADGKRQQVEESDIASIDRGGGAASTGSGSGASIPRGSGSMESVRSRADQSTTPVAGVNIWQQFIDSNPSADDLKIAKQELEKWKTLEATHAEKIKGRWVGGEELKGIMREWKGLHEEGIRLMRTRQTLAAMKKFEAAQVLYPNSFPDCFWLGYLSMGADNQKANNYFSQALRLRPNSPETLANIAVIQLLQKRDVRELGDGVMGLYKAAQNGDTPEIAQDLVTALTYLPEVQKKSDRIKPAVEAANILASKYNIHGPVQALYYIPLRDSGPTKTEEEKTIPGSYYSGTGFVISADGLILTNRHVVKGAKTMRVQISGRGEKSGTIVKIDDEQDLALVKVVVTSPLPFVSLSPGNTPNEGAECTVMGFPMIDRFGPGVKITRGIVTSNTRSDEHPGYEYDVMVDAKVNPGNSGGPILDKYGNVMAIISMKSVSDEHTDSFGLGISAGQIRKFLKKANVAVPVGLTGTASLSTEDVVTKVKPATVCILSTH